MIFASAIFVSGISKVSASIYNFEYYIYSDFVQTYSSQIVPGMQLHNSNGAIIIGWAWDNPNASGSCNYFNVNYSAPLDCYINTDAFSDDEAVWRSTTPYLYQYGPNDSSYTDSNLGGTMWLEYYFNRSIDVGETYTITYPIGVSKSVFSFFKDVFSNGTSEGLSNYSVDCYSGSDDKSYFDQDTCYISFDYTPPYPNLDRIMIFYNTQASMSSIAQVINWNVYPIIQKNVLSGKVNYFIEPNKFAFISGCTSGNLLIHKVSYKGETPYFSYYDLQKNPQTGDQYLDAYDYYQYGDYLVYDFDISRYLGADMLIATFSAFENFDLVGLGFWVDDSCYVDIVKWTPVGNSGNSATFHYKGLDGQIYTADITNGSVDLINFDYLSSNGFSIFSGPFSFLGDFFSYFSLHLSSDIVNSVLGFICIGTIFALIIIFRK